MSKHIIAFIGVALVLIVGFYLFKHKTPEISLSTGEASIMAPIIVGDLNNDDIVNSLDWSIMSTVWFTNNAAADLNHDGFVNSIDFSILNNNWFRTVP